MDHRRTAGSPEPLGVTSTATGINVAVFSAHATRIDLCLFDAAGTREIARIPLPERTGDVWHGHIEGVSIGARYGLRAHGPYDPVVGHRFNPFKLLVDPYAVALDRRLVLHPDMFGYRPGEWDLSFSDIDSAPVMPKAIVTPPVAPAPRAPLHGWPETILYELNVRGFSRANSAVPEAMRGTFRGLGHPASIAHLASLGITTVEIMPAAAWIDERHLPPLGLTNAWGYNPVAFMAPEPKLAPGGWADIRTAVDALHQAGIEVIVDVVLNHCGESDELGPTVSLRGLDNASYYRLNPHNLARYIDDMGCGNVLALDRPPVVRMAMDALRTWVRRAGIDGFRFDLATALGRRADGFDPAAPLIAALRQDPELCGLKLIAEPWDIGPGGYQAGRFPAGWGEWNDRYRDDVRRFWRGESFMLGALATRIAGSSDLFHTKRPARSINFVTAHDGFALADLVSFSVKHNDANGENNRDGTDANYSWNHGIEGPTADPAITEARRRDQINLLATLLLSRGTPMLQMGTELGHSQAGNNNAYAQDNALTWLDWSAPDSQLLEAARALIAARRRFGLIAEDRFLTGEPRELDGNPDAQWMTPAGQPLAPEDWGSPDAATLALHLTGAGADPARLLMILHRGGEPVAHAVPATEPGRLWEVAVDTARPATEWRKPLPSGTNRIDIAPRSVVLLAEAPDPAAGRKGPPAARPATVDRLASAVGITADWWDLGGTCHVVPEATRRALLTAMGLDVTSQGGARDALEQLAETRDRRRLPATLHGRAGRPIAVPVVCGAAPDKPPRMLSLTDEAGARIEIEWDADHSRRVSCLAADGRPFERIWSDLPPLAAGRYRLLDETTGLDCQLTVAPERAQAPMAPGFGLSAQLYTLRSGADQGIGDFSTLAEAVRHAANAGAATFGINPLHALNGSDRSRVSPYHPSDRRFLDPIYIDVTALDDLPSSPLAEAMLAAAAPEFEGLRAARSIDYARVSALKLAILKARFEAFRTADFGGEPLRSAFFAFVETGGAALERFATFRLIEERQAGKPWATWEGGLADANSRAVRNFAEQHRFALAFEMYLQWLADRQLAAAAQAARDAGLSLGLYRDLAVGCAPDGAEVWAQARHWACGASVGAPPDPFSATGQIWNLPPPNPLTLHEGGFSAWRSLLAANMRHAGMLRIDHVMGLTRLFCVPDGALAAEGAYVAYPRDALLAELQLESHRRGCRVVGEDLGTVPDGFRQAMADADILSYRVLWFEREGEDFRDPATYPADAVACLATHDLPTLAGWWNGSDLAEAAGLGRIDDPAAAAAARAAERQRLIDALIGKGLIPAAPAKDAPLDAATAAALHAYVAASPCRIAFAQMDDLAGETEAVNLPGTDRERPNWRRRLETGLDSLFADQAARSILAAMAIGRSDTISLRRAGELAKEQDHGSDPNAPDDPARPADGKSGARRAGARSRAADAG
ncbi:MAG TPA: glycogen debranching protein GlgX [Beijerinckiaceae bacterium]|nr:glycogen debranching protein GlgX [Beijerinckiaceae bacterium]